LKPTPGMHRSTGRIRSRQ